MPSHGGDRASYREGGSDPAYGLHGDDGYNNFFFDKSLREVMTVYKNIQVDSPIFTFLIRGFRSMVWKYGHGRGWQRRNPVLARCRHGELQQ